MTRTLKLIIQIFWAMLGGFSAVCLFGLIQSIFAGWLSLKADGLFFSIPILMFLLSCAFLYGAYLALFRFSPAIVGPTLALTLTWLNLEFIQWHNMESRRVLEAKDPHMFWVDCNLVLTVAVIFFSYRLYRRLLRSINAMLFPWLRHSAARVFSE